MTVELSPEQEQIIRAQIASGLFRSADEVLSSALAKLASPRVVSQSSQSGAVKRMIEFAEKKAVKLPPGEKVKDLVHEGHRY